MRVQLRRSRVLVSALGIAVLAAGLTPGAALAARGGSGKGGTTTQAATLTVAPNPAPAFSYVHASGCGYVSGQAVVVNVVTSTAIAASNFPVDASGCASFDWYVYGAGSYTFKVYQDLGGKGLTLMATSTESVI